MFLLLLVILLNTAVTVLFKFYGKHRVDTTTAIVVNYWASAGVGSLMLGEFPVTSETLHAPWLYLTALLGAAFFIGYSLFSYAIQHYGVTTSTVSSRLALVLSVVFTWVAFSDSHFDWVALAGVLLAFPAVYLTAAKTKSQKPETKGQKPNSGNQKPGSKGQSLEFISQRREIEVEGPEAEDGNAKPDSGNGASKSGLRLGWGVLALFLIGGALDIGRLVLSRSYVEDNKDLQAVTTIHIFVAAALLGTVVWAYRLFSGKSRISGKSVLAGLLLAVPDYFANYLFVRVLASDAPPPSVAVPANNIGIVVVSVLAAYFLFKEEFGVRRAIGIGLSLAAIFLISYKELFS